MPNFFKRAFKYANASANAKLEAKADPKIQLDQAVEEAQKQHAALTTQAAAVVGNVKSIELKLGRQLEQQAKLRNQAGTAIRLADEATAAGDTARATQMTQAAQSFAGELVSVESSIADLQNLHGQAETSAAAARRSVDDSASRLKDFLAQRSRLMTQLQTAKMQEQVASSLEQVSGMAAPGDTPTLDQVRDKIENRYATASGRSDLAQGSLAAQQLEVERASIDGAAALKLEEIRASLAAGSGPAAVGSGAAAPALEAGSATDDADGTSAPA